MKFKKILLIPILCLLPGCNSKNNNHQSYEPEQITYYAFFMNNYPRATLEAPSGYGERVDNTLFLRQEISLGEPINKPSKDPERENYEFLGWYKEKGCVNEWNFASDIPESTLYLYAKWGMTGGAEYMEPEYKVPEKIITDANYRVTGILNMPLENNKVNLTAGAIGRLENSASDVKFAVNYERKESVTLTKATYNAQTRMIHLEVSSGETWDIEVNDITASLSIANENSYYETKAQGYEEKGGTIENYHIALGGSSSMENWSTSTLDMSPIITFNHGIGGTTVQQWTNKLFQRLILPYSPKAVVYYVGVNNIINGDHDDGTTTGRYLNALFDKTHEYLPNAQIFYVMINKLPGYPNKQNDFDTANNMALLYSNSHKYLTCIDAGKGLLKDDGLPNASYFLSDGLHMSKYGYVIWGEAVKEAIINWLDSTK